MGGGNVYNMEGLMGVDTFDIRKTIMFLMEGHHATPICAPFEIFADEIHWELFANLFSSIYRTCANISSKWDYTNTGPVHRGTLPMTQRIPLRGMDFAAAGPHHN